jgi:site-specific recombinase XerC
VRSANFPPLARAFVCIARRDTAIIAVLKATGIRLAELAGLRYNPGDPRHSVIYLWQREITVRGKGGKDRIVRIGHQAAGAWTGTSAPAPDTRSPGGRSCG